MEPGHVLQGRYEIESVIGRGGMGVVYLGRHLRLGTRVAIKEMQVTDTSDRDHAVRAFEREGRLLAAAGAHPNLVRAIDCFDEGDHLYLVMEYVEGKDLLRTVNDAPGYLPVPQVLHWMDQACEALEYLHGLQPPIIYRDLKPANLMLEPGGRVRLIDFGIARTFSPESHTTTRVPAFSPGFAPIEQHAMGAVEPRTDVYALGATMYALLTRRIPPSAVERIEAQAEVVPPSVYNHAVPPALDQLILHAMALRAVDRCASTSEVRRRLRDILANGGSAPLPSVAQNPLPPVVQIPLPPVVQNPLAPVPAPPPVSGSGDALPPWSRPTPPVSGSGAVAAGAPPWSPTPTPPSVSGSSAVGADAPPPTVIPPAVAEWPRPPAEPRRAWGLQMFLMGLIFVGVAGAVYFARAEHETPAASSSISVLDASPSASPSTPPRP